MFQRKIFLRIIIGVGIGIGITKPVDGLVRFIERAQGYSFTVVSRAKRLFKRASEHSRAGEIAIVEKNDVAVAGGRADVPRALSRIEIFVVAAAAVEQAVDLLVVVPVCAIPTDGISREAHGLVLLRTDIEPGRETVDDVLPSLFGSLLFQRA